MKKLFLFCLQTSVIFFSQLSFATYEEFNVLGENSRWAIDASTWLTHNLDDNNNAFTHALGLDIHKVFSGETSDIGTLVFQPYIVKINNYENPPFTFDDGNDTELTWRIANFNYTALSHGQFNIKVGHFEVPFGLEYAKDTNGTLRQFTFSDRGIKGDWGVSVNGIFPELDYEIALTRGSGNDIRSKGNPHIFSGRIGTPSNKNIVAGLSWFTGDVIGECGVIQRKKFGIDATYYYYQWEFSAESSVGSTNNNDTVNGFIETLWMSPRESVSVYVQLGYQSTEVDHVASNATESTSYWLTGVQWLIPNGFDISAQYKHKLKDTATTETDSVLNIQIRYRI